MNISKIFTQADEESLRQKMTREFTAADTHTRTWKNDTEDVGKDYLFPKPGLDRVKVRKVWNNLVIRKSIFLSDDIQVKNVSMNGVLWKETAENWNKVFASNFVSMNIRDKYEEALTDDALQWVWVLTVDGWNNHSQEPIVSYVDSRLTFPDPKNWRWNKMRYFGTLLRKNIYELEGNDAYDQKRIQLVKLQRSTDLDDIDRANNDIVDFTDTDVWEGLVDTYNHITIFKWSKDTEPHLYLTTWGADMTTMIRAVKMRGLTDDEKADPSKISLWVELFRWKPIKWSFAGASLIDEIGQYQDIETLLTNLQIKQAKTAALWGRTYMSTALGMDSDDVANNSADWDVVPYTSSDPSINAANGILREQPLPINPITSNTIGLVGQLAEEATNTPSQIQWFSQAGNQTKAEVQTLQQNINQIISLMASNYMETLKCLWEDIYRSYAANMSPQRKKKIVVVDDSGATDAYWFKKHEFISDGEFYIVVKSKSQEDIKNKQDFAIILSVYGSLKQWLEPGSVEDNILDRTLLEKSGIRGLNAKRIKPYTRDERLAYENLELLNNDIELKTKPVPGENHNAFINIYKTGLDTPARTKAIFEREQILTAEPEAAPAVEEQKGGWVAQQLGASMLAWEQAGWTPSIADVAV